MSGAAFLTPAEVAARLNLPERTIRREARRHRACVIAGKAMRMSEDDVARLVEALRPCPIEFSNEASGGGTEVRLPSGGYAALQALRTKQSRNALRPKKKREHGNVVSMDPRRS